MVNAFMLAMVHHPDVQKRAQVELESVLRGPDGKLRLPTHDDEPLLPYCTAVVKETFRYGTFDLITYEGRTLSYYHVRWLPIAPVGK